MISGSTTMKPNASWVRRRLELPAELGPVRERGMGRYPTAPALVSTAVMTGSLRWDAHRSLWCPRRPMQERVLKATPGHHPVDPDAGPDQRRHHIGTRRRRRCRRRAALPSGPTERMPVQAVEHRWRPSGSSAHRTARTASRRRCRRPGRRPPSRPLCMTTTWVQVCSTSASRWRRDQHRAPVGRVRRAAPGASRRSVADPARRSARRAPAARAGPSIAWAMASRCFMPWLYVFTRRSMAPTQPGDLQRLVDASVRLGPAGRAPVQRADFPGPTGAAGTPGPRLARRAATAPANPVRDDARRRRSRPRSAESGP